MEKVNFQEHDKDFAVMFDAASFLLRSFDLYSALNAGQDSSDQCKRYKKVMREVIILTAKARVRAAMNDLNVPEDII